jgi:hypothetical protein
MLVHIARREMGMRKGTGRYENWLSDGFPGWLRERLDDRLWSLADLERATDHQVKVTVLSRWMTGRQLPNPDHVVIVARALSVSEHEALRAAGYLSSLPATTDPRREELRRRIDELTLTHDRYLALNALLVGMEAAAERRPAHRSQRDLVTEEREVSFPPAQPPADRAPRQPSLETEGYLTAGAPSGR